AQARPTTGSSTGPVSTSESHSESNPSSSSPFTSSASASVVEDAPAAPTPMRIFAILASSSRVRSVPQARMILLRPRAQMLVWFHRRPPWRIVLVVIVHLVDGTFELFRYFLSPAAAFDRSAPVELRAVRGVVGSVLGMLEGGATHVGVATDHVIESFRNRLWADYKTGEGIDPLLLAQFVPLEEALAALGVVVWPMVEFEADDALAAA